MKDLPLFPQWASAAAHETDLLFYFLLATSAFFTVVIFTLIFVFAIKYRRRRADQLATVTRGNPMVMEIAWTVFPLILVNIMFFWGAKLFIQHARPPENAMEIYVVGKQWMWKLQHPEGQREINTLHVPANRPVKLIMTSEDVIHSFFIPAFRIKQDVLPGRYTTLWFNATKPGEYHLFCTQYCGTGHASMLGSVVVMDERAYERWIGSGAVTGGMASAGERLFNRFGCANCHQPDGRGRGPVLQGLYGRPVALADGSSVMADEAYIRESILNPNAKIVAGYPPDMPTFQGIIDEEGLLQIMAYLKSLRREELQK